MWSLPYVWSPVDNAYDTFISFELVTELVLKALLDSLEFSDILFDVFSMEGVQVLYVSKHWEVPWLDEIVTASHLVWMVLGLARLGFLLIVPLFLSFTTLLVFLGFVIFWILCSSL